MEEPHLDPRRELRSALGLLILGIGLIVTLGPPRFADLGTLYSSLVFLVALSVVPLVTVLLDRWNIHP